MDYKRKKGSDKQKETFKKYGKNTSKGLRKKMEQIEKRTALNNDTQDHQAHALSSERCK